MPSLGLGYTIAKWFLPVSQRDSMLGDLEEDARRPNQTANIQWWVVQVCSIRCAYYVDSFHWHQTRAAVAVCLLMCPMVAFLLIGSAQVSLGGPVPDQIPRLALLTPAVHTSWLATGAVAGFAVTYFKAPRLFAAIIMTALVFASARIPAADMGTTMTVTTGAAAMIGIWLGSIVAPVQPHTRESFTE